MTIVGLPNQAVEEAKERVKSGLTNSGFKIAPKRITINLAPADVKKEGASFDLAIAAGILIAQEIIPKNALQNSWVLGEVALTGEIRNIRGVLPIVRMAQRKNIKQIFIPTVNSDEAAIIEGVAIYPVENIFDLVAHLRGEKLIEPILYQERKQAEPSYEYDLAYVKGQEYAKRALEVAAAGGHKILLIGAPGSGKNLFARCLASNMPPKSRDEEL
jgi:magnesium chelatase family protein